MSKGDLKFALLCIGGVTGCLLGLLGLIYGIITVAKWAWES